MRTLAVITFCTILTGCTNLFYTENPPLRKYPTASTYLFDARYNPDGSLTGKPYGPGPANGGGMPSGAGSSYNTVPAYPFGNGITSNTGSWPYPAYGLGITPGYGAFKHAPGASGVKGPFGHK